MRTLRSISAAVALLFGAAACSLVTGRGANNNDDVGAASAEVAVQIDNYNWSDVTVYLIRSGGSERLGRVAGLGTATFFLPFYRLTDGSLNLRAYPLAGRESVSESVVVRPGQAVQWTLENDLRHSSVMIF